MNLIKIIATFFGLGYIPFAPGTFGALGGYLVSFGLAQVISNEEVYSGAHIILILVFYVAGAYACKQLQVVWGPDPSKIVIDETVGFWISILFLPPNLYWFSAGFVLFRFFDIVKPLGIRNIDKIHNHHAVMLDDVLAGVYSNIILQACFYTIGPLK